MTLSPITKLRADTRSMSKSISVCTLTRHNTLAALPPRSGTSTLAEKRVADKWLKDRRGRKRSYEDLSFYQKIIVALSETRLIMSEIDDGIPQLPIE